MAIVNKIRERSGIAVAVIAVALLLFIVGGDIFSNQGNGFFGSNNNQVGEINGTTVDYQQFVNLVESQKLQFENNSGRSANEQEVSQIREQVWEKLIFDNVYVEEFEKLGITVSDDELRELIQGTKNMHPYVKQQFSDQSGNFNAAQHAEFIRSYSANTMPAGQKAMWDNFKRELKTIRMREKYSNLLNKASFVTQAEAKAEYVANTEKASGKFLYVPFYSIQDSTVKVEDSEISSYYGKHKEEFNPFDSRSITYVSFQLVPTKEDSSALNDEIRNLAKGLASATDAQAYASANTDIRTPYLRSTSELSENLKASLASTVVGGLIGPFKEGNTYSIHKYEGTSTDSLYTVRASHILIRSDSTMSDSARAAARTNAQNILNQARSGADFATLASQNGTDGTAQRGGDLGTFQNNGSMVKPFESAVFAFSGTGVLPNLVTTDFGYHIINVTEAKSNTKYKLASINKELQVGEAASNEMYQKAENLRAGASTLAQLETAVKKDNSMTLLNADNLLPNSTNVNTIQNAREIVNWAYSKDAEIGAVADRVFVIGETYVVAALKSGSDKNDPKAMDFKDAISAKIRNEKKSEKITAKLGDGKGDLTALSKKYGAGALVEEVADVNFFSGMLNSAGFDPIALGKLFGLKAGQRSGVFTGESGVFVMETTAKTPAPAITDYAPFKLQVEQRTGAGRMGMIGEQILRENAKIEDNRAKMF
ncbi:peptidylprolyl isomerase [Lacihabitans sp. LS3-19]|uniref:peptidylprolyl isomerase n=1 Tax=Lacihabitans sp. LS3-19 TaxID=2487335 RepID=UPI0020CC2887|nr:peptidylprolyl isomerase [Lacihabitans sp. LS3-19]MCP9767782.1 peptidylprolyl isomerase [Lacihabitans sp. LS3-19]